MQPDRGLAGTRRSLHAYRRRGVGADDLVLLRLDRGDDVAHRADARALDLVDEDLAAPDVARLGRDEVLVLVGGEPAVVYAEPAAQPHAHRLAARGPVERAGQLGAPVDDDRVAQLVVDVPPADVPALLAVLLVGEVEPPEEQRRRRVVDEPGRAPVPGSWRGTRRTPGRRRTRGPTGSSRASGPARDGRSRGMPVRRPARRSRPCRQACERGLPQVALLQGKRQCTCGRPQWGNRFREPGKGETGRLTLSRDGRRG